MIAEKWRTLYLKRGCDSSVHHAPCFRESIIFSKHLVSSFDRTLYWVYILDEPNVISSIYQGCFENVFVRAPLFDQVALGPNL